MTGIRRVELLDTSVLLEILDVPFESDNRDEVLEQLAVREDDGVQLYLSVAAIVEAGGHVGRIDNGNARRKCAQSLRALLEATLEDEAPWRFRPVDWDVDLLRSILDQPTNSPVPEFVESLTTQHLEVGDMLIVAEFRRLRRNLNSAFIDVDVWTRDNKLRGVIDGLRVL